MTITTSTSHDILPDIPDPESIRRRLAIAMTEAAMLRAQLRVSIRLKRERERLRHQDLVDGPIGGRGDE
jgi:hypothetical protein